MFLEQSCLKATMFFCLMTSCALECICAVQTLAGMYCAIMDASKVAVQALFYFTTLPWIMCMKVKC